LQLALKGLLEKVLQWNDPRNVGNFYSLEIDVLLLRIFKNLMIAGEETFEFATQLATE
jgi:hypothetical protein